MDTCSQEADRFHRPKAGRPHLVRVLVAHRVRVVREALALLLRQCPEVAVVDLDSQVQEGRQVDNSVDVTLVDTSAGVEATAQSIRLFRSTFPCTRVIVLGSYDTPDRVLGYIRAGASGYLPPHSSLEQLIETIQTVSLGGAVCPPEILALLFQHIASLQDQPPAHSVAALEKLTRRELEVLELVAAGCSNKEISMALRLEVQTVKNHVHNILDKLQVRSRRQVASYARAVTRNGLPSDSGGPTPSTQVGAATF